MPSPPERKASTLDGLGGNDSVKIVGTSANESFETWQDHGIFKSGDFEVDASNFESFALDGDGGNDSAIVHDRDSAADTFVTGPGWVTMNGGTMPISNVENLHHRRHARASEHRVYVRRRRHRGQEFLGHLARLRPR